MDLEFLRLMYNDSHQLIIHPHTDSYLVHERAHILYDCTILYALANPLQQQTLRVATEYL